MDAHPMALGPSCAPAVVLIVEDEMMLRMRAVDMVEDAGYTPIEPLDADEAVAILESRSDIALMCTDIQMPGSMDGLGLRMHDASETQSDGPPNRCACPTNACRHRQTKSAARLSWCAVPRVTSLD